jgi:alpha-L-rhamnosidase
MNKAFLILSIIGTAIFQDIFCINVSHLQCNYKENPVGINSSPQFGWILQSDTRNQFQTAYQIMVSDDAGKLDKNIGTTWDTKKVTSSQSILISYQGKPLEGGKEYYWKVKVWDKNGHESAWSNGAKFTTALFGQGDWMGAKWIGLEDMPDSLILIPGIEVWGHKVKGIATRRPLVPMFRDEFKSSKEIASAYLFITGLGQYKGYINGKPVSNDFLSPGWTLYNKTCLYDTYDVTTLLKKGDNAIGVMVGNGFHNINSERYHKMLITFGMPKMICRLKIKYEDGSEENVVSGTNWKAAPSPVTFSSIYGGEDYDAQLEQDGWDKPGFNDKNWQQVLPAKAPGGLLEPETAYPITVHESFHPVKVDHPAIDTFLYDFGQNASGIVQIKVTGKRGQKVRLYPGELVNAKGFINQNATGRWHYYEYTLKGEGVETWQPQFTYYGFRYVQVTGAVPDSIEKTSEKPRLVGITSIHTYNSAPREGSFSCSNELFNRINQLILYAIQSNLQSVVTDCPHRERLGWLEQTYLMGGSIQYNFQLYHLYSKLVNDMIDSQDSTGLIPEIAPEMVRFSGDFRDSPEWGSAGIIIPWLLYQWYGDRSAMKKAWPMMIRYMAYLEKKSDANILSHGLGDWYDRGPARPGYPQLTPKAVTASAIYYYDALLMSKMSELMEKPDENKKYADWSNNIKAAFNSRFYNTKTGVYSTGSQTSMAIPLCLGLINGNDRDKIFNNLIDSIAKNGKVLTAGDIGFHFLIEALTLGGASQLIFEMNNRDDVPGYGFQLKKGATALTESWDALAVVSNNHLMLGHIMEWFYKGLGGINQEDGALAYKKIVVKPAMVGDITDVNCNFISPYGLIKSQWKRSDVLKEINVEIPVNTTATVYLPASVNDVVKEGGKLLKTLSDIKIIGNENGSLKLEVGSGLYRFTIEHNN